MAPRTPTPAATPDSAPPAAPGARWTEYRRLADVTPAHRNPKGHAEDKIRSGMLRFGYTVPVLHDERTGRLVAGHGRLEALAAMEADPAARDRIAARNAKRGRPDQDWPDGIVPDDDGAWMVPVIRGWASDNDEQANAYLISDNRLTEMGEWDRRLLAEMLEEIRDDDLDLLADTGYETGDLEDMLRAFGDPPDLDALAGEVGEPTDEDGYQRVAFKVPANIAALWRDTLAATGQDEETAAATAAVKAAYSALTGNDL